MDLQEVTTKFYIITFFVLQRKIQSPKYDIDKITLTRKQGESFYNQKNLTGYFSNLLKMILNCWENMLMERTWCVEKFYENGNLKKLEVIIME